MSASRQLLQPQVPAPARVPATEQPRGSLVVWYCQDRAGWCVWRSPPGMLSAELEAGPFARREEAEALLGGAGFMPLQAAPRNNSTP